MHSDQKVSATPYSHGSVLGTAPTVGRVGQGRGWVTSDCPGPAQGSTRDHILLITCSFLFMYLSFGSYVGPAD